MSASFTNHPLNSEFEIVLNFPELNNVTFGFLVLGCSSFHHYGSSVSAKRVYLICESLLEIAKREAIIYQRAESIAN